MRRVVATFAVFALVYPLAAAVTADIFGLAGALTVAGLTTGATLLLGVPAFLLFRRRGWLGAWQFALGGALIGGACTLPFAFGGAVLVGTLAPAFAALGLLHGLLFWLLAVWQNADLSDRSGRIMAP